MYKYRNFIKKIAIVDFDVHHGNGTEDIIKNLQKNQYNLTHNLSLDSGINVSISQNICKPWLDFNDDENVLFISLHGYDVQHPEMFYPSSGGGETNSLKGQKPYPAGIFNIPIIDQNKYSPEYKKIFLEKVVSRLNRFKPDMIFISAGFDGHELEDMNLNYMKLNENDYRFITEELTNIAYKYCEGRIISVLEGGYNINSGIISSFAQSVMTHAKFLNIGGNKFYYNSQIKENLENPTIRNLNIAKLKAKRKREFFNVQEHYRKIKKIEIYSQENEPQPGYEYIKYNQKTDIAETEYKNESKVFKKDEKNHDNYHHYNVDIKNSQNKKLNINDIPNVPSDFIKKKNSTHNTQLIEHIHQIQDKEIHITADHDILVSDSNNPIIIKNNLNPSTSNQFMMNLNQIDKLANLEGDDDEHLKINNLSMNQDTHSSINIKRINSETIEQFYSLEKKDSLKNDDIRKNKLPDIRESNTNNLKPDIINNMGNNIILNLNEDDENIILEYEEE